MTVNRFAAKTKVSPVKKTRGEIEKTLRRYGADSFLYASEPQRETIGFIIKQRHIRFQVPMPQKHTLSTAAYEQACRQRWRALALTIKAKLEAVESNISTLESEFLAHIVLPDGSTVGQWVQPQLDAVYRDKVMPKLLAGPQ